MTDEKIKRSLESAELKLSNGEKFTHYGIVGFCFFIPFLFMFFHLKDFLLGMPKPVKSGEMWFLGIPTVIGIAFYILQKKRLKFKVVENDFNRVELDRIIEKVAKELEWDIIENKQKVLVAKTYPGLLSGSWGEQITILFDNKKVFVNSICDPSNRSSLISTGRNRQNENALIKEILMAKDLSLIHI